MHSNEDSMQLEIKLKNKLKTTTTKTGGQRDSGGQNHEWLCRSLEGLASEGHREPSGGLEQRSDFI